MRNNLNEHKKEYVDLVDEDDNVIGKMRRSERGGRKNFRVIDGFLINSKGEIWIPRRTAGKLTYPLGLDFSFSGYVKSGETYERACERELGEELNMDLNSVQWRELGKFSPFKDGTSCFRKVYEIKIEKEPNYNKEDIREAFWISPKDLIEKLKNEKPCKIDLPEMIRRFYLK